MDEVIIEGDGKFPMDVRIPIANVHAALDGRTNIMAKGAYRDRQVGAEISIRRQMKPGIVNDDIDTTAFYGTGVIVRAAGDVTRHLAEVLSEIYVLPSATLSRYNN
jgi:hypothetical protein